MEFLGSLISGASSLINGIFNRQAAEQNNLRNIAEQQALATNGITMRAADARQAEKLYGINALTALGVTPASFSNVTGDTGMGDSIARAGQDIGRAVAAGTDKTSKADQLNEQLLEAKIANIKADTVRIAAAASALATKTQPGNPPGVPLPPRRWIDGAGPDAPIPLMQQARDPRTGELVWIPSEKAASPLQTLAASPTNLNLAAKAVGINTEGLLGDVGGGNATTRQIYDAYGIPY